MMAFQEFDECAALYRGTAGMLAQTAEMLRELSPVELPRVLCAQLALGFLGLAREGEFAALELMDAFPDDFRGSVIWRLLVLLYPPALPRFKVGDLRVQLVEAVAEVWRLPFELGCSARD